MVGKRAGARKRLLMNFVVDRILRKYLKISLCSRNNYVKITDNLQLRSRTKYTIREVQFHLRIITSSKDVIVTYMRNDFSGSPIIKIKMIIKARIKSKEIYTLLINFAKL